MAFKTDSRIPASPIVRRRLNITKAWIRVASSEVLSDQISATELTICLRNLRNCKRYGRIGSNDFKVIRIVAESVKFGRKWLIDVANVLIRGESFLNCGVFV